MKQKIAIGIIALAVLSLFGFVLFRLIPKINSVNKKEFVGTGHPGWPPITWQNNDELIGAGPDLMKKISRDLGFVLVSRTMGPFDQTLKKMESGEADVYFGLYKTSDREPYMEFSEAYAVDPVAIFVKKGKEFSYERWNDLADKKGIGLVDVKYGESFSEFSNNLDILRSETPEQSFDVLNHGEADYFIYSLYAGQRVLSELGLDAEIVSLPNFLTSENLFIGISKKSPLVQYLPQINEEIRIYKNDGTIDGLIAKYRQQVIDHVRER